ncbi:MAG: hypothetical protein ABIJ09_21505 [Pseudomonadota bacterium]
MSMILQLRCDSLEDLRRFVDSRGQGGVWLLPAAEGPPEVKQFERLELQVTLPDATGALAVEVLQLMPDGGLVVRLLEPALVDELLEGVEPGTGGLEPVLAWMEAQQFPDPESESGEEPPAASPANGSGTDPAQADSSNRDPSPAGVVGPAGWPIEKLLIEWPGLSVSDRIMVAKRGQLAARRHVLKLQDRNLQQYVLANPGLTSDEVAAMAAMTTLEPELLKRIGSRTEWLRHSSVVRNLICNPKVPMDLVEKLLGRLPETELRKLAKTGRVRDSVKRLIISRVSRGT